LAVDGADLPGCVLRGVTRAVAATPINGKAPDTCAPYSAHFCTTKGSGWEAGCWVNAAICRVPSPGLHPRSPWNVWACIHTTPPSLPPSLLSNFGVRCAAGGPRNEDRFGAGPILIPFITSPSPSPGGAQLPSSPFGGASNGSTGPHINGAAAAAATASFPFGSYGPPAVGGANGSAVNGPWDSGISFPAGPAAMDEADGDDEDDEDDWGGGVMPADDGEPGFTAEELRGIDRVRGHGLPERYGDSVGGILKNRTRGVVGGRPLGQAPAGSTATSVAAASTSVTQNRGVGWLDALPAPAALDRHAALTRAAQIDAFDMGHLVAVRYFRKDAEPVAVRNAAASLTSSAPDPADYGAGDAAVSSGEVPQAAGADDGSGGGSGRAGEAVGADAPSQSSTVDGSGGDGDGDGDGSFADKLRREKALEHDRVRAALATSHTLPAGGSLLGAHGGAVGSGRWGPKVSVLGMGKQLASQPPISPFPMSLVHRADAASSPASAGWVDAPETGGTKPHPRGGDRPTEAAAAQAARVAGQEAVRYADPAAIPAVPVTHHQVAEPKLALPAVPAYIPWKPGSAPLPTAGSGAVLPMPPPLPQPVAPLPAPAGSSGGSRGRINKPCAFYRTRVGCRNGNDCPFIHDPTYVASQGELDAITAPDRLNSTVAGRHRDRDRDRDRDREWERERERQRERERAYEPAPPPPAGPAPPPATAAPSPYPASHWPPAAPPPPPSGQAPYPSTGFSGAPAAQPTYAAPPVTHIPPPPVPQTYNPYLAAPTAPPTAYNPYQAPSYPPTWPPHAAPLPGHTPAPAPAAVQAPTVAAFNPYLSAAAPAPAPVAGFTAAATPLAPAAVVPSPYVPIAAVNPYAALSANPYAVTAPPPTSTPATGAGGT